MEILDFGPKNESSPNRSTIVLDHSGGAYGPGNVSCDALRPPAGPPRVGGYPAWTQWGCMCMTRTLKITGKVENLTENENFSNRSPVVLLVQVHSGDACGPGNALEARQGAVWHRRRRCRARRHPESGPGQSRNGLEKIHFSVQNPKFPAFRLDPDRRPGRVSGWTRAAPTVFFMSNCVFLWLG